MDDDKIRIAFEAALRSLTPASESVTFSRDPTTGNYRAAYVERCWRLAQRIHDEALAERSPPQSADPRGVIEGCMFVVTKGGHSICQPPRKWHCNRQCAAALEARQPSAQVPESDTRPCSFKIGGTTCGYPENQNMHEGWPGETPPIGRHKYQPAIPGEKS